ncbi:MAG: LysM domain-containing protein [Gemmatimonadetes bacterium]|nr:LysM domain-containing protein [Gemmatimonadota bacterium]
MIDPGSRYHGIPTAEHTSRTAAGERTIRYLQRRFLPHPGHLITMLEHRVSHGDRLDNLSARYLGDALGWWRMADANLEMQPEVLTDEAGRRIRIATPKP